MVGGHQGLGCNRQRIGGGDQIGFVAHKEIHDGDQNGAVFRPALPEPGHGPVIIVSGLRTAAERQTCERLLRGPNARLHVMLGAPLRTLAAACEDETDRRRLSEQMASASHIVVAG